MYSFSYILWMYFGKSFKTIPWCYMSTIRLCLWKALKYFLFPIDVFYFHFLLITKLGLTELVQAQLFREINLI